MYYFMDSGPKYTGLIRLNAGGIDRDHVFPIFDILSRSGNIRDQSRKLCKIGPNFACFLLPQIFQESAPPEFLDLDYLIGVDSDHVVKFRGDRPRELGDPVSDFKKNK